MRNLVIAAHPDDEVLGCGGTIAKLAGRGDEIFIAILGEGITSRYKNREEANAALLNELHNNSKKAGKLLGAKDVFSYDFPDNRFDTVPMLDIVKLIEGVVDKVKPQVVYTQHGGDLNIDHSIVFRSTLTALRPIKGKTVRTVYAYEVPSSTDWAFGKINGVFSPNVFVDISDTLEVKIKAMRLYESEARSFPHPRSDESLKSIALRWGSAVGVNAAEAFELIRDVS